MSDTNQIDKMYPDPPPGIRVWRNGAGQDIETGKVLFGPGTFLPDPNRLTPDRAAELHQRRQELAIQAAERALIDVANEQDNSDIERPRTTHGADVYTGWRYIVAAQARLAMRIEKGRASTEAAKFIGKTANLTYDAHSPAAQAAQIGACQAKPGFAALIMAVIREIDSGSGANIDDSMANDVHIIDID